ncbi:LIM domain protein [Penicillium brasilianum]|uniref:LIM domain protein n=1 Tax=Penicillium brasilianum TaxID=104259 RepID=A0A1S9RZK6_PENBI|nr:LIM domain protein [Penicillium brasilianum]
MMHKHPKPIGQRKVSPPGPSYMNNDQMANYLKDLRTNRPARPTGSRPYPGKSTTASSPELEDSLPPRAASAFSMYRTSGSPPEEEPRCESAMSHRRSNSNAAEGGPTGRPLAQEPRSVSVRKTVFPSQIFSRPVAASPVPSYRSYRESKQRHQEKEEARELRDALQGLDLEDDIRLHHAAQDEATELVWMHQNPGMAYKNPYAPYQNPDAVGPEPSIQNQPRKNSGSGSSPVKHRHSIASSGHSSGPSSPEYTEAALDSSARRRSSLAGNSKKNLKVNFSLPEEEKPTPKPRTVSGDSSKGVFRNPEDHIYEEPQATDSQPDFSKSDSSALRNKPRNALPRLGKPLPWLQGRNTTGSVRDKISKFDIHKNPPSRSRDPGYTKNEPVAPSPPAKDEEPIPMKDGKEIRSDDIRAATSKKLKDRSEKLPMPSAVSNRMGRPIVSFDPKWQPSDQPKPKPQAPTVAPPVPTIIVAPNIEISDQQPPPPIPVINLPDVKEPTISEMIEPGQQQSKPGRSIPQPPGNQSRQPPVRRHPSEPQRHAYTPYARSGVPTARCESCSLSISGKIVTAGGCRFHPECFICHHCHTALECVAFYEEPEASRAERLSHNPDEEARIPRFYCHLDFHELFSPRCKSCKTPIEGEVVVACGAEWHVGHFFCAECGDPFNSTTPFVEKDGFAWCLQCHGRRTAPRCLGCKQHVLDDLVISAIGGQWHERCFVCHECGDGFGDEGRFFVREGEPKRTAKGRIIGGPVQLAICERCEGIRLKAPGMC